MTVTDTPENQVQPDNPDQPDTSQVVAPDLPPAAQRALAEAEERRRAAQDAELPKELGGRNGLDPVRFGDWEKKGIAIDF
ncbi:MAG: DUF1674 domain-containing protein [Rhodobacterales bacterium]